MSLDEFERHLKELDVLSRYEEVRQALDRALAEISTLTNRIKELESEVGRLQAGKAKCEGDTKDLRNTLEKRENELNHANDEIKELKKRLDDCQEALPKEPGALPKKRRMTLEETARRGAR